MKSTQAPAIFNVAANIWRLNPHATLNAQKECCQKTQEKRFVLLHLMIPEMSHHLIGTRICLSLVVFQQSGNLDEIERSY